MNEQSQIKALAELDEFRLITQSLTQGVRYGLDIRNMQNWESLQDYLHSYDAIIPLLVKICNTPLLKVAWLNHARAIVGRRTGKIVSDFDIASIKPDEDCEALLRATGKWED